MWTRCFKRATPSCGRHIGAIKHVRLNSLGGCGVENRFHRAQRTRVDARPGRCAIPDTLCVRVVDTHGWSATSICVHLSVRGSWMAYSITSFSISPQAYRPPLFPNRQDTASPCDHRNDAVASPASSTFEVEEPILSIEARSFCRGV